MSARPRGTGALEVRRTKAGQDVWYARFRVGGQQQRHRLGVMTKTEAGKQLAKVMAAASARPMDSQRRSVDDAAQAYIDHVRDVRGRKTATVNAYTDILENHIAGRFRGSIDRLDVPQVKAFRDDLLRSGLSPRTVAGYMTFLGGVCRFAIAEGWSTRNPVASVEKPQARKSREIRFLEVEELEAVLRVCPADALGRIDRAMILAAAMTGMRQGELLGLRWRDVDWPAGVIRVEQAWSRGEMGPPKSEGSERVVMMVSRVAAELDDLFKASLHQADDALVFALPSSGAPQDPSNLRKRWVKTVSAARLGRPVRFHDLRHSYAVWLARAGVQIQELQEYLGHSSITTTQIYSRYAPDTSKARALAEGAFGGLRVPDVVEGHNLGHELSASGRPERR